MLDQLLNSKIRAKLLVLFYTEPENKYYIHEIVRLTGGDPANTHRELKKLELMGLLVSHRVANLRYYELSADFALHSGLKLLAQNASEAQRIKWVALELDPNLSPSLLCYSYNTDYVNKFFESVGLKSQISSLLNYFDGKNYGTWMLESEYRSNIGSLSEMIQKDHAWLVRNLDVLMSKLENFEFNIKKLEITNLANLLNKDLYQLYRQYIELYGEISVSTWIVDRVDCDGKALSNYLLDYLITRIKKNKIKGLLAPELFAVLSTPVESSRISKEYDDLLLIVDRILENEQLADYFKLAETRIILDELPTKEADINALINSHTLKYCWMGYGYIGSAWGREYFVELICSLIRHNIVPKDILEKNYSERTSLRQKQRQYQSLLDENDEEPKVFLMARGLVAFRNEKKAMITYFCSVMENLYHEICKRTYLSVDQIRFLYPKEMEELLLRHNIDLHLVNARLSKSVRLSEAGKPVDLLVNGSEAELFMNKQSLTDLSAQNVLLLLGDCACAGRARGLVRVINDAQEFDKFVEGEILVTDRFCVELVPAIKKAGALIFEEGSLNSDGALIARELNIPCIVGVKNAIKLFHNGNMADIDARNGKITVVSNLTD